MRPGQRQLDPVSDAAGAANAKASTRAKSLPSTSIRVSISS